MVKSILEPDSWLSYFMHDTGLNISASLFFYKMKSIVYPSQGYCEDPVNIQRLEQGLAQNKIVGVVLSIIASTQTSSLSP